MVNVGNKSKIQIKWKVNVYDYSVEKRESIITKFSEKYNIPKKRINLNPDFILLNENGEKIPITSKIVENIQDPLFQQKLMAKYLSINNIIDYDFDMIKKIDAEINDMIDYSSYKNYNRYSINWVKWDNFLSYGENNYFDFTNLKDLVLLNGNPANQSGKTTFAIDLIHFLLFGKTDKSSTQDKIFNKHIPEATKVTVEGSLTINGENYIIKRELTRTSLEKRNSKSRTNQKVSYYKIVGDSLEELEDYVEDFQGESSIKTNKIIKEAIGNESDFDMIICATSSNLDELIEKKDTERGKLLSRWIGLVPLEEKDILARKKYNETVKPTLISNNYNTEYLLKEISSYRLNIDTLDKEIKKYDSENSKLDEEIKDLEKNKKELLELKTSIDNEILKIDINTLNEELKTLIDKGNFKKNKLSNINNEIEKIGDVEFSNEEYESVIREHAEASSELKLKREKLDKCKKDIEKAKKEEVCPYCHRKYDDVNNAEIISNLEKEYNDIVNEGKKLSKEKEELAKKENELKSSKEKLDMKSKFEVEKAAIEVQILKLRNEYIEKNNLKKEYNKNHEAIDKNNKLDIQINNIEANLKNKRNTKDSNLKCIVTNNSNIEKYNSYIDERVKLIDKINEETKLIRHWKLYFDMVGKNGISKMVLRNTLPIINAQISTLLNNVCDFTVSVEINDKNEIMFYLVKDGIKSDLFSGSGFERTASALALRTVLGKMSTLPKINFLILDEIMGRVAKENYDNMRTLYEKMLSNYDFIIQISHLDEIKEWHNHIITVTKTNNISKLNIVR